ncbi:MAG: hypothetical protein NUV60_00380 [Patescibacteria group bacterium]|nr:hypothetical protein [Patescibacteria group bacterium]
MENELTNLLPPERQRAHAREYILRLGVVATVLVTVLIMIAGLLLVPTFLFLTQSTGTKQSHLTDIESLLSSADEKILATHLAALSNSAAVLTRLGELPSASTVVRSALSVSHPGVALAGFTYTPTEGKTPGTLSISGTAATRESLRNYQLALQGSSFAAAVDLPVSAYARDAEISFTITVTLTP